MIRLSLSETAERHGVSAGGLSDAVHENRPIQGMALYRYAELNDGKIAGFEFPDWYSFPEKSETVFMTIAELVDEDVRFSRGKIEEAIRREIALHGFDLHKWAVRDDEGVVEGFEVPKNVDFAAPIRPNETSGDSGDAAQNTPDEGHNGGAQKNERSSHRQNALLALGAAVGFKALTSR